jgi:hypothetical protein
MVLEVKYLPILDFLKECKPKVHSLALKEKKRNESIEMGLEQIHKCEFKKRSQYTQTKKKVYKLEPKWCLN